MIDTKLVMITGISGTGKSTTARFLSNLFFKHQINHVYLHEESINHPIRNNEFSIKKTDHSIDLDKNMEDMLNRYQKLTDEIISSEKPYILEACFYEMIIRYFYETHINKKDIVAFFQKLYQMIKPLNPVIIFLHTHDVKYTLNKAFPTRGNWWKKLILNADHMAYMKNHNLEGESGVYTMWHDYQATAKEAFDVYDGPKILCETYNQDYKTIRKQICKKIKIGFIDFEKPKILNPQDYIGSYLFHDEVQFKIHGHAYDMFVESFWPRMEITYIENDHFKFDAFPIDLFFKRNPLGKVDSVLVKGNYDWDIMDKVLNRVIKNLA